MPYAPLSEDELIEHCSKLAKPGLALDIDDTLSYTDSRWVQEMLDSFANPESLTREEVVAKYGWFDNVPYWKSDEALARLQELVHSNDFNASMPVIPEAREAVAGLGDTHEIAAYITARPESVLEGTQRWLAEHGFPDAPLIMRSKQTSFEEKNSWKARLLVRLYPHVIGIVDDHPELPGQLADLGYRGTVYLYDNGKTSKGYGEAERYRTWDDIASALRASR
jgi:5'(3')-deoxyribonucleotidase